MLKNSMMSERGVQRDGRVRPRIVLDAMGGDHAPEVTVEGGLWAARDFDVSLLLVGPEKRVRNELEKHESEGLDVRIVHASEWIRMEEQPATAVRAKPHNSMSVGLQLVKRGEADAFVTCGHTGAALAASLFTLGRIRGVKRPALTTIFPTRRGHCFILDIGANADCKPEYLQQFAVMGSIYARHVFDVSEPRVGLLSIGEEGGKGSILVQETFALLENMPDIHFVGNVEPKEVLAGIADVVVTDGFTGNIFIKTSEAVAAMLLEVIKAEIKRRPLAVAGALLAKGAFKAAHGRLDPREYGGAPLLGVNGIVIVGHGRSDAYAVRNAVRMGIRAVEGDIVARVAKYLSDRDKTRARSGEDIKPDF